MIYEYRKPDNRDKEEEKVGHIIMGLIIGFIACLLITMCTGCTTTKYVTVPEYHTDTVLVNKTLHDSIWVHDSVMVTKYQKGDTIFSESTKWHTKYVLKEMHDTLYQSRTDSIPYPVEVVKEVPAQLTWWQQTRLHLANIILYAILIILTIYIIRILVKKQKLP